MKQEKQEKEAGKDLEMGVRETKGRSRGDPGILRSLVFRDVGGSKGTRKEGRCWRGGQGVGVRTRGRTGKERGEGGTRTIECGGVLGSPVRSDEGRSEVRTRGRTGKERGKGGTRTIECGGVLGSPVRSDEGRSEERDEKKT